MPSRVTLKAVNDELARQGHRALLAKAAGYFYFWSGDAADWLDRTVNVPTLGALTLEQWIAEFERLKKLNGQLLGVPQKGPQNAAPQKARKTRAKSK